MGERVNPKKIVIIGGGPGGYVAAIRASQLGAKVTLMEKERIGGTCLNRGCIPTKALLHDAKLLRSFKNSPTFQSLSANPIHLLESMMDRKQRVVDELVKGVEVLLESHRVTVKYGRADLLGFDQVILFNGDGRKETFEADAIVLSPGSKSKNLSHILPDREWIITSDEALKIKRIPKEIVIIGGGYIGVEFATLFNTLGSEVTIVEILETLLPGLEGELVRNLRRFMEKDGVRILTQSSVEDIQRQGERVKVAVRTPHGIEEIWAEKVLLAVGRVPNLDLDFSKVGIETSSGGIRVNKRMETSASQIYAIGDAIGGVLLAHVAMEEGILAAENLMGVDRKIEDRPIPLCIFTYPEIASIGLTEKEAKARGAIKVGRFPFRSNPKAVITGETDGLIKVVASRETDEILGVHIIGPEASVLISIVSSMMREGGRVRDVTQLIQAHPTLSEALKEAFLDVDGMAIHLPRPLRTKA